MTEAPAPAGADTLVAAVREGDASAVRTLLAADPSLAGARDPTGVSVVVLSHYHGHAELGELLASGRDDLDLFEAATVGRVESLEAVLATDPARVATLSPDGFTALHLAAFLGRVAAVERLLAAGAPVDTRSANAMSVTPLHSAAAGRHLPVVTRLLAAGADPDSRQHGGWTALHAAALHGDHEMADALLAAGADPTVADDEGRRPADLAGDAGHLDLAGRLEPASPSA